MQQKETLLPVENLSGDTWQIFSFAFNSFIKNYAWTCLRIYDVKIKIKTNYYGNTTKVFEGPADRKHRKEAWLIPPNQSINKLVHLANKVLAGTQGVNLLSPSGSGSLCHTQKTLPCTTERVCSCTCCLLSTKLLILLTKWGHFSESEDIWAGPHKFKLTF